MDVARFKHPPHWVALETIFHAMTLLDSSINLDRGYAVLGTGRCDDNIVFSISAVQGSFGRMKKHFSELQIAEGQGLEALAWTICFQLPPEVAGFISCAQHTAATGSGDLGLDDLDLEIRQDLELARQVITHFLWCSLTVVLFRQCIHKYNLWRCIKTFQLRRLHHLRFLFPRTAAWCCFWVLRICSCCPRV